MSAALIAKARMLACATAVMLLAPSLVAFGQDSVSSRSLAKVDAVEYLYPEQVTLAAGKTSPVALHFRIAPGLHINSHAPKDEFLIPTVFSIPEASGVHLDAAEYAPGKDFTLPADPATKLSVYTGEFKIQARITPTPV